MWPWQQNQNSRFHRTIALVTAMLVNGVLLWCIYALTFADSSRRERTPVPLSVYWARRPLAQRSLEDQTPPPPKENLALPTPTPRMMPRVSFRVSTVASSVMLADVQFTPDAPRLRLVAPNFSIHRAPRKMPVARPVSAVTSSVAVARPVMRTPPQYPIKARQQGIEGFVTMLILVGTDGRMQDVKIRKESPEGIFRTSALRAVKRWRFRAPEKATWQRLTIVYELEK